MELSKELAKLFEDDFKEVLDKEINEQDYLMQEDFSTCKERADAIIDDATKRLRAVLGIAIAKHREDYHNEDRKVETAELSKGLDDELISTAMVAWWMS